MDLQSVLYYYVSPAIGILAMLLNIVEIAALVKQYRRNKKSGQHKHSNPIVFLANLALSDFLVGSSIAIVKLIHYLVKYRVIRFTFALLLTSHIMKYAFLRLSLLTSVFNLVSLTIDRLLAIRYPIVYRVKLGSKHAFMVVGITWVLSIIITAVLYYVTNFSGIPMGNNDLIIFPAVVFPATVIFAISYGLIMYDVHRQGRNLRIMTASCSPIEASPRYSSCLTVDDGTRSCSSNRHNLSSSSDRSRKLRKETSISCIHGGRQSKVCSSHKNSKFGFKYKNYIACIGNRSRRTRSRNRAPLHVHKREIKIYKLAGTVVGVYLLCWIPIAVWSVLEALLVPLDSVIGNIAFTMAFLNSAIDPLVYFAFSSKRSGCTMRYFRFVFKRRVPIDEKFTEKKGNLFSVSSSENNGSTVRTNHSFSSLASHETTC